MKVGDEIKIDNSNWKFNGEVVKNFEQHITRSVPFYQNGHNLICDLGDFFIKDDSIIYELGSSTGQLIYKIAKKNSFRDALFYGIDIEKDMINYARSKYKLKNLQYICDDINTFEFEKSDLMISYYTIQFIHPKFRQLLIDKIYNSLNWGGAFIMFEKVRANDARFQDILTTLYTEFKLNNGYSPEEIIAKTMSLKGVLEPFSSQANVEMLKRAGFIDILTIFKYLNFEGIVAIK